MLNLFLEISSLDNTLYNEDKPVEKKVTEFCIRLSNLAATLSDLTVGMTLLGFETDTPTQEPMLYFNCTMMDESLLEDARFSGLGAVLDVNLPDNEQLSGITEKLLKTRCVDNVWIDATIDMGLAEHLKMDKKAAINHVTKLLMKLIKFCIKTGNSVFIMLNTNEEPQYQSVWNVQFNSDNEPMIEDLIRYGLSGKWGFHMYLKPPEKQQKQSNNSNGGQNAVARKSSNNPRKRFYRISEVARMTGLSEVTLRRCDDKLKPLRTPGGHRRYTEQHIKMIKQVTQR